MKKGISPFIAFILVVAISVASVVIIMRLWGNSLEKFQGYAAVNDAKGVMSSINSAVKEVSVEGEGSSRKLSVSVSGGEYRVSAADDSVIFILDSGEELFPTGLSEEGDLTMETHGNYTVSLTLDYESMDIVTDERWSGGSYNILVRNNGTSSGKVQLVFDIV